MSHIVIDPVTRIEGHLRIEAEVDGGVVRNAWSSATMFRGVEIILKGRDPRDAWAFTQRICGVCTTVHSIASIRAVENAIGAIPPPNARLLRNLIMASQMVQDHVVHFYHLHALDWVDIVSALSANPAATSRLAQSISDWPLSSTNYFRAVKERVQQFVQRGQLGPFANAYWGHSAYRLPPEANLLAVAHYLEALGWQRDFIKMHAVLGGKNPHLQSFLVGGMATPVDPDKQASINITSISTMRKLIHQARKFVEKVYIPDLLAVASFYKDWAGYGAGVGNYLAYGEYPETEGANAPLFLPRGVIRGRDLSTVEPFDPAKVTPNHRTIGSIRTASTAGSSRRAMTVSRWRWGRSLGCWWLTALVTLECGSWWVTSLGSSVSGLPRCSRRSGGSPRGASRHWSWPRSWRAGSTSWRRTWVAASWRSTTTRSGSPRAGPMNAPALASTRRRAALWATGCISWTARSRTTSAWCRAPGTGDRAMQLVSADRMRRRSSERRWRMQSSRSRFCARCIPSIPAWHAACMSWTPRVASW